jgi:diguanylate cyclase (GGDEF)-like protein
MFAILVQLRSRKAGMALVGRISNPRASALDRYSLRMGTLVERHLAEAALIAAKLEAERTAAEALQAKQDIEQATAALREEIAMRIRTEARLEHIARHDPLTGLPNRTLLNERLDQEMQQAAARGRKLALLYIDLDNFKDVNDTLGHAVGDNLLRQVAARFAEELAPGAMVARIGGDEFALLQVVIEGPGQAATLAERLITRVCQPFAVDNRTIFIGASIGITCFPDDAETVDMLQRNADLAMYLAKSEGRNRWCFYDNTLNRAAMRRALLEQALREPSLQSQLEVVFQPQVDLLTDRVGGVEALMRWRHPEQGLIPPQEFIPAAERSGMILDLGTWVLRESCRQAVRWRQAGLPRITVSVNVSTAQFRIGNMPHLVAQVLAETGLPPSWLELEITETGIMHDVHVAAEMLVALHQQGVGLAIDDFGTGYSSLSYLRRLPVDRIKIDQSFINDVTTSEDAAMIATTIVKLAHSLRLQVVAEGVETAEQVAFVRQTGCAYAQGYFYGEPMAANGIPPLLNRPLLDHPLLDHDKPRELAE